jgi:hypothetical protein
VHFSYCLTNSPAYRLLVPHFLERGFRDFRRPGFDRRSQRLT